MRKNQGSHPLWQYATEILSQIAIITFCGTAIACEAPMAVCQWKERIVGIKTPNMIASGISMEEGLIITNHHVVEDHKTVLIRDFTGDIKRGKVIPHNIQMDLAIISYRLDRFNPNISVTLPKTQSQTLYVVAFDQGRNAPRVYKKSNFALYPNLKTHPTARIYSNSGALPGNSGGAVVNQNGELIGILASGDRRISEIIPSFNLDDVFRSMDDKHAETFFKLGGFIRKCADALHLSGSITKNPPDPIISKIKTNCLESKNKQLIDQAGQTFGRWWMFDISEKFLRKSESLDPNSPNTLMSLAVTYHLSRRPEQTVNILKRYVRLDPSNHQALRMGIQTAGMVGDRAFADQLLQLMEIHNPAAIPLAKSYIENAFSN